MELVEGKDRPKELGNPVYNDNGGGCLCIIIDSEKVQFGYQGGYWCWIKDFLFCGKYLNLGKLGVFEVAVIKKEVLTKEC